MQVSGSQSKHCINDPKKLTSICFLLQLLTRDMSISQVASSLSQFVSVTVTGLAFLLIPGVSICHKLESMMSFMCYLPVSIAVNHVLQQQRQTFCSLNGFVLPTCSNFIKICSLACNPAVIPAGSALLVSTCPCPAFFSPDCCPAVLADAFVLNYGLAG